MKKKDLEAKIEELQARNEDLAQELENLKLEQRRASRVKERLINVFERDRPKDTFVVQAQIKLTEDEDGLRVARLKRVPNGQWTQKGLDHPTTTLSCNGDGECELRVNDKLLEFDVSELAEIQQVIKALDMFDGNLLCEYMLSGDVV